jgi:putative ABC transport system permease protein
MAVVLSMIGIYNGLVIEALTIVRAPAVDVWVVEAGTQGPFAEASRIPGETRASIARLHGVAEAGSVTYQTAEVDFGGRTHRLYLVGFEPGGPLGLAAGRPIGRSHHEIIADTGAGLALGDRIPLGRDTFEVVGLVENQVNSGGDPAIYLPLRDAQVLQFELTPPAARVQTARGTPPQSENTVNAVLARLDPNVAPDAVAATIRR